VLGCGVGYSAVDDGDPLAIGARGIRRLDLTRLDIGYTVEAVPDRDDRKAVLR
jgi:hypothetical protein